MDLVAANATLLSHEMFATIVSNAFEFSEHSHGIETSEEREDIEDQPSLRHTAPINRLSDSSSNGGVPGVAAVNRLSDSSSNGGVPGVAAARNSVRRGNTTLAAKKLASFRLNAGDTDQEGEAKIAALFAGAEGGGSWTKRNARRDKRDAIMNELASALAKAGNEANEDDAPDYNRRVSITLTRQKTATIGNDALNTETAEQDTAAAMEFVYRMKLFSFTKDEALISKYGDQRTVNGHHVFRFFTATAVAIVAAAFMSCLHINVQLRRDECKNTVLSPPCVWDSVQEHYRPYFVNPLPLPGAPPNTPFLPFFPPHALPANSTCSLDAPFLTTLDLSNCPVFRPGEFPASLNHCLNVKHIYLNFDFCSTDGDNLTAANTTASCTVHLPSPLSFLPPNLETLHAVNFPATPTSLSLANQQPPLTHLPTYLFSNPFFQASLRFLNLSSNAFTSTDLLFANLAQFANLTILDLSDNYLDSFPPNSFLKHLGHLDLSSNNLTAIPLSHMTSSADGGSSTIMAANNPALASLSRNLTSDPVPFPSIIKTLASLSSLSLLGLLPPLDGDSFTNLRLLETVTLHLTEPFALPPQLFANNPNLASITFHNSTITDVHSDAFSSLPSLTSITFFPTTTIHTLHPDAFNNLNSLPTLDLSHLSLQYVHHGAFSSLPSLSHLDLSHNLLAAIANPPKLTAGAPPPVPPVHHPTFVDLPALATLDLSHNPIVTITAPITSSTPLLSHIDLSHNPSYHTIASLTFGIGLPSLTSLSLTSNYISTIEPNAFQNTAITNLDLSSQALSVLHPNTFRNMNALSHLSLANNEISDIAASAFHGCTALSSLDLSHNALTSLKTGSLQGLSNLTVLNFTGLKFDSLERNCFDGLYNLKVLNLKGHGLTAINTHTFQGLRSLVNLTLSNNEIASFEPEPFAGLNNLETLDLTGNKFTEIPDDFALGLEQLTDLRIFTYTPGCCATCLCKIKETNTVITRLGKNAFADLRSLTSLDLSHQDLHDLEQYTFHKCKRMKTLDLSYNQLVQLDGESFDGLYELEHLDLGWNGITRVKKDAFKGLMSLTNLTMTKWKLAPHGLDINGYSFAHLASITSLYLNGHDFLRVYPNTFHGCSKLVDLDLEFNSITRIFDGAFNTLSSLKRLNLNNNNIKFQIDDMAITSQHQPNLINGHCYPDTLCETDGVGAFTGLYNLEWLSIAKNECSQLKKFFWGGTFDDLHRLKFLDLSYNELYRMDDFVFQNMTTLLELSFRGNGAISSGITLSENTFVGLDQVYYLDFFFNSITHLHPEMLAHMRNLTVLDLSFNKIQSVNDIWWGLITQEYPESPIKKLNLEENLITKISAPSSTVPQFEGLTSVTYLNLNQNTIEDISNDAFSQMPQLKWLSMNINLMKRLRTDAFKGLNNLEYFSMTENIDLHTIDPYAFSHFDFVTEIDLSVDILFMEAHPPAYTAIGEHAFSNMTAVAEVNFKGLLLTEIGPYAFSNSPALKKLDFSRVGRVSDLNDDGSSGTLQTLHSNCFGGLAAVASIDLSRNAIATIGTSLFKNSPALSEVLLNDNEIGVLSSRVFADTPALSSVDLTLNSLHTIASDAFDGATSITQLDLSRNAIAPTSFVSSAFAPLVNLDFLDLSYNMLDDLSGSLFNSLGGLKKLDLTANGFATPPPGSFDGLLAIEELDISHNDAKFIRPYFWSNCCNSLVKLEMRKNKLQNITAGAFSTAPNLEEIDFEDQWLRALADGAFENTKLNKLNLANNRVQHIPAGLFDGVRSTLADVDVSDQKGGGLLSIEDGAFADCASMTHLNIFDNKVEELTSDNMAGLTNLKILNVGTNEFEELAVGWGAPLGNLEELLMDTNDMKVWRTDMFSGMDKLKKISSDWSKGEELELGVFSNLELLEYLHMGNNKIELLREGVFEDLTGLKELYLVGQKRGDGLALEAGWGRGLGELETLDLSKCALSVLPEGSWEGVNSALKVLLLGGNDGLELVASFEQFGSLEQFDAGEEVVVEGEEVTCVLLEGGSVSCS